MGGPEGPLSTSPPGNTIAGCPPRDSHLPPATISYDTNYILRSEEKGLKKV